MSKSKISKNLCSDIAEAMANNSIGKKIKELRESMLVIVDAEISKQANKEVVEFGKKYPNYVKRSYNAGFSSDSLYETVDCSEYICPVGEWRLTFQVPRDVYDLIMSNKDKIYKLKQEERRLISTIEKTLLSLKSYKNIQEKFTEAWEYFPDIEKKEQSTELSLPIDDILKTINKYK